MMNLSSRGAIGVRRIAHLVLNVTDLDASTAFYGELEPLRPHSQGRVSLPSSPGLGIDGPIDFSWRLLEDGTTGDPTRLMLVQWHAPELVGEPYADITATGLVKLAFNYTDVDGKLQRIEKLGTKPTNEVIERNYVTVLDPDGTIVSFRYLPDLPAEQLFHTNLSTYDLPRQLAFWEGLIGLDYTFSSTPTEPRPASQGPNGSLVQWSSHFFCPPGDARFFVDVGRFQYPEPHGEPHRAANAVGLAMIAVEVDDLEEARKALQTGLHLFEGSETRVVGDVEVWPMRAELVAQDALGRRAPEEQKVLHLRDPDGTIVQLIERPPAPVHRPAWPSREDL